MRFWILLALFSILACSSDNNFGYPNQNTDPVQDTDQDANPPMLIITSFFPRIGFVGDYVTVIAQNIDVEIPYVVKFNGLESTAVQINSTSIIAMIPIDATSGNISIEYEDKTIIVGEIEIRHSNENLYVIYLDGVYCQDSFKVAEVDMTTGEIVELFHERSLNCYELYSFLFSEISNTLVYSYSVWYGGGGQGAVYASLYNFETGESDGIVLRDTDHQEFDRRLGNISGGYLYYSEYYIDISGNESLKLIRKDLDTFISTEIFQFSSLYHWELTASGFISETNTFFAFTEDASGEPTLLKINLDTDTLSHLPVSELFSSVIVTNDDTVYAIRNVDYSTYEIVEIDPNNGNVVNVVTSVESDGFFSNLRYSESTNRFFAAKGDYVGPPNGFEYYIYRYDPVIGEEVSLEFDGGRKFKSLFLND